MQGFKGMRLFGAAMLVAASALTGCATAPKMVAPNYDQLITRAEASVAAGQVEAGLATFDEAAKADTTRKEPWHRIAQLQFDAQNYGRAAVAAEEVLKRDPDDLTADSILTVSALRIAVQAVARLQGRAGSAGSARSEAEKLAQQMRDSLGEDVLIPKPDMKPVASGRGRGRGGQRTLRPPASTPEATPVQTPAQSAAPEESSGADPFGSLEGDNN